jgi:predicted metal-dependent phosphoesterase TrpH
MAALVDLHLHTTASDGRLVPRQLVHLAAERGLQVISVTDHDSTEGLAEAQEEARRHPGLTLIPGIELSVDVEDGEVHLLGYFLDHQNPELQATLKAFRGSRELRGQRMVEKLASLGVHISWERVVELANGGAIGRPHIAQAMVEKGYIKQPQEAFIRYLGRNGLAYVEREKLTSAEAARLLLRHRGLPVLAHPAGIPGLEALLRSLKQEGLVGLEVFYGGYSLEQMQGLLTLAERLGLLPCGGSDYHALGTPGEPEPGSIGPPMETAHRLMELASR